MKRVRLLGLALMAVFAFGVVSAATASAAEAGLLFLPGESGLLESKGTGEAGKLTSAAGTITCTAIKALFDSKQKETHITEALVDLHFTGCKETKGETKVACNTEKDEKEVILLLTVATFFNALDVATKTVLEPGVGATIVNSKDEPTTIKIKCGAVAIIEVKGTVLGLALGSLTADVTLIEVHFTPKGELCDTGDSFCKKSQEKANELLANFTGAFETATEEILVDFPFNKMMLIDD